MYKVTNRKEGHNVRLGIKGFGVRAYDADKNLIGEYISIRECARKLKNISMDTIRVNLNNGRLVKGMYYFERIISNLPTLKGADGPLIVLDINRIPLPSSPFTTIRNASRNLAIGSTIIIEHIHNGELCQGKYYFIYHLSD